MDPATLISLSSVFGLMATFFQERRGRKETETHATLQDYIEWLERGRHTEIVELLKSNQDLMAATDRFMRTGHDEILDRFDRLETLLSLIMGVTAEWGELIKSIDPNAGLSEQAIEILRWFDATGASGAFELKFMGGAVALATSDSDGTYYPNDQRFYADDMKSLVGLGLLIPGVGSKGSRKFTITRAAIALVQSLDDQ